MFDNLREQAKESSFYEDKTQLHDGGAERVVPPSSPSDRLILGMTPPQRFAISLMLMIVVCMLGVVLLLVTGHIGLV